MVHEQASTSTIRGILRLIRPVQWSKNVFVLAGLIFSRQWNDDDLLTDALLAFFSFCAAASATYVFNDWQDVDADRAHPVKRLRPLASSQVTLNTALWSGLAMLAIALACSMAAGLLAFAAVAAYLLLNVLYSRVLKHVIIADVFTVAAGFMLRLVAGTVGIGIAPSNWLVLTSLFLTLFLGFSKRRAEWTDAIDADSRALRRRVMNDYSVQLLDTFIAVTATAAILSYGLYTVDPEIQRLHGTTALVYTVPFVVFAIFRYLYLVHTRGQGENPSLDLFADAQVLICAAAWLVTTVILIN